MKFTEAKKINVNGHVEKIDGRGKSLSYLSWSWAWAEFKERFPDATYEVKKFDNGLPYVKDSQTGYMVFTSITAEGETHEMWLPVMDSRNNAMKDHEYVVKTKFGETHVDPADMFDINKTIMRCLTKNMAMFGLGLYIYNGEDLPEAEEQPKQEKKPQKATQPQKEPQAVRCSRCNSELKAIKKKDGSTMSIDDVAKYSKKEFGKILCEDCMKAQSKAKEQKK